MTGEKHTPTPWRTTKKQTHIICNDGGDKWIARAMIGNGKSPRFIGDADVAEANAAFIVEAVNSFASLQSQIAELRAENERTSSALAKISELRWSEVEDPLEDACDIADAALQVGGSNG